MTMEDHLRRMIGDLVFHAARLSAENDLLKAALTAAGVALPQPPAPPPLPKDQSA